jgi:ferredoxin
MVKKIKIDSSLCIGCNTCVALDPDHFELDSATFKAKVKEQPKEINSDINNIIDSCPVKAIKIIEEN